MGADFLEVIKSPAAQVVILIAVVACLATMGFYIARKLRDDTTDDQPASSELLTKFKELHARGGLSDEEFRTIKAKLAAQLQNELKDNEQPG